MCILHKNERIFSTCECEGRGVSYKYVPKTRDGIGKGKVDGTTYLKSCMKDKEGDVIVRCK